MHQAFMAGHQCASDRTGRYVTHVLGPSPMLNKPFYGISNINKHTSTRQIHMFAQSTLVICATNCHGRFLNARSAPGPHQQQAERAAGQPTSRHSTCSASLQPRWHQACRPFAQEASAATNAGFHWNTVSLQTTPCISASNRDDACDHATAATPHHALQHIHAATACHVGSACTHHG